MIFILFIFYPISIFVSTKRVITPAIVNALLIHYEKSAISVRYSKPKDK